MRSGPAVFVADVHIASGGSALADRFIDFLRTLPGRARDLFILGDLFDLWIGHSHADLDGYRRVLSALHSLDDAGVRVSFISGNRDFFFGDYLMEHSGIRSCPESRLVDLDGKRVRLCHGDLLCARDVRHLRMRRLLRSRTFRTVFFALPTRWAYYLASCLRRHSQRVVRSKHPDTLRMDPKTLLGVYRSGVDVIICGHTHRGEHRVLDIEGRRCELFVLDAWSARPGFLEYRDGKFARHYLR